MSINKRTATAHWQGRGTDGVGKISTCSNVLQDANYGYQTRFVEGAGTNPEELIAAAHASCFAMKLAFNMQAAGFTPMFIDARCEVMLEGGRITESHLSVYASVPGLLSRRFQELVDDAQENCPISKLLRANITYDARLA
jgi:osmotically inducible protein OsmC